MGLLFIGKLVSYGVYCFFAAIQSKSHVVSSMGGKNIKKSVILLGVTFENHELGLVDFLWMRI